MALTQVGARKRLTIGHGRIDTHIQPLSRADYGGEQTKLATGATPFAFYTRAGQAGFGHGALNQLITDSFDFSGNGFKKRRACL